MQLLILLVVIVGIVAIGQLAKVYELSSRISGRREEDISHADTRLNANLFLAFVTCSLLPRLTSTGPMETTLRRWLPRTVWRWTR